MFYVVVAEEGFCYIPGVTVVDEENFEVYNAEVIAQPTITRDTVNEMLINSQAIAVQSLEQALDLGEAIYKKLPRYRRTYNFAVTNLNAPLIERYGMTVRGAGTLLSEISDKYL